MKKLIVIFCILTFCPSVQAQQVKPDVINSLGGSTQYTGGYLAYSVGEPVIGTAVGTNTTLTQGFLQTWQAIVRQLALKLFIEGLYSGGEMMHEALDFDPVNETFPPKWNAGIADTISVVLYDNTYANLIAKYPGVYLYTNGNISIPGISSSLSGSYYITIFHRNSVPITSATPRSFGGSTISYDFSTASTQAYTVSGLGLDAQKNLTGGVYGMYTGELNQDTDYPIDGFDLSLLEVDIVAGPYGYLKTDLNGDGVIDGFDLIVMEGNIVINPLFQNPQVGKKKLLLINQNYY